MLALRARCVFAVDGAPLRDGIVVIDDDRILAVGAHSSPAVGDFSATARDLGNVAILPGFVNPHTHLEFSDLRSPLGSPGMAYPDWIRLVIKHRREHLNEPPLLRRIDAGLTESTQSGVTALGEIASTQWGQQGTLALEVTEFIEMIGLRGGVVPPVELRTRFRRQWSDTLRAGISPHAPYSVHPDLVKSCAEVSAQQCIPLAHHLAESREELALLRTGGGPFRVLLEDLGVWNAEAIPNNSRPLDYLRMLAGAHRAVIIHGNYLDDVEIAFLASHADRMSVIYCPRTHAYFQHDHYPLAKLLTAGVNVAIGTDSRASTPDLNLLAEMRFAAQEHRQVALNTLLRMITASAAKALGREDAIGTVAPGKLADLVIVQLPDHDTADPHELLMDPACHAVATIFRGRAVHGEELITAGNL